MNDKGKKIKKNKKNENSKAKKQKQENHKSQNVNKNFNKTNSLYLIQKELSSKIYSKYNCSKKKYELFIIEYLLNNANCRLVSIFKEKMLNDYIEEFLHRKYIISECEERMPKLYKYYKNYLIFFCKPIFNDMKFNKIIQNNGEKKAELYYKRNYLKSNSIDNIKDNGFEKTNTEISSENQKNSKNKNSNDNIFTDSIKEKLENVSIMTTISNGINKSINLNIDNEKLEVFCENKYDKSNDTTVVNFINNYKKELNNKKNKNNTKKIYHADILFNNNNYNNFFSRNKYKNINFDNIYKTNAISHKLLLSDNLNNFSNKILKKRCFKNFSSKKNKIKNEKNNRKISIEKVRSHLKLYFTNLKYNKLKKELIINKNEKPKVNISLKMIHKGYYKLEKELKNILINYRKNMKDKYNQICISNINATPINNKNKKSRNNNNFLYKESSMLTGGNVIYGTKNNKSNNLNVKHINNKSYNFSSSTVNMKINKKNIKNLNSKNNGKIYIKIKQKFNNLSIKTESENKILNYKNNTLNSHKNDIIKDNNTKFNIIKINKNSKLLKNNNLKKNESQNRQLFFDIKKNNLIKTNDGNNSKENIANIDLKKGKIKARTRTYNNKSRNYEHLSSLTNVEDLFFNKNHFSKNKSINYNSANNLNKYQTYKSNKKILHKNNKLKKKSNIKKHIENMSSNLMHISLPLLNSNNLNNNKFNNNSKKYQKYIYSFNNIHNINKNSKIKEYKKNYSNSISNNYDSNSKFNNQLKKNPNSNSKNKIKSKINLNNNSSSKKNKKRTITSYIAKEFPINFNKKNKQYNFL